MDEKMTPSPGRAKGSPVNGIVGDVMQKLKQRRRKSSFAIARRASRGEATFEESQLESTNNVAGQPTERAVPEKDREAEERARVEHEHREKQKAKEERRQRQERERKECDRQATGHYLSSSSEPEPEQERKRKFSPSPWTPSPDREAAGQQLMEKPISPGTGSALLSMQKLQSLERVVRDTQRLILKQDEMQQSYEERIHRRLAEQKHTRDELKVALGIPHGNGTEPKEFGPIQSGPPSSLSPTEEVVLPAVAEDIPMDDSAPASERRIARTVDKGPDKWSVAWWLEKSENFIALLIVFNAVALGAEIHNAISSCEPSHLEKVDAECKSHAVFRPIDLTFTIVFTIELLAKIYVQRWDFLKRRIVVKDKVKDNPDFNWNAFDSMIVSLSLLDEIISLLESVLGGAAGGLPLKQIKMLRLLRVVRVMRILRTIRFVRDLRVMLGGILSSAKSISWALLIVIAMQYVLAIIVQNFIKMSLEANAGIAVPPDNEDGTRPFDREFFLDEANGYTKVDDIIWYLFLGMSGGADWGDWVTPLTKMSLGYEWLFRVMFMTYMAFTLFCKLNILTGVFVENANKLVSKDEDSMLMNELEQKAKFMESIHKCFVEMDVNGTHTIDADEFVAIVHDERMQALFKRMGVDVTPETAQGFFTMLDFDGDGQLSEEEFRSGITRLSGVAKSFDMAQVLINAKRSVATLEELLGTPTSQEYIALP
jgi:hypothetical protein